MSCRFNPIIATKTHPLPRMWCDVLWGYCQFQKDELLHLCPIHNTYTTWFQYWVFAQPDLDRKVLVDIDGTVSEYTVSKLRQIFKPGWIRQANIEYEWKPEPEEHEKEHEDILKTAIEKGYATIYCDQNHLISLGTGAFKSTLIRCVDGNPPTYEPFTSISLPDCLYIGARAFYDCTALKTVSFAGKSDTYIPVLDNINAFMDAQGKFLTGIEILVPAALYDEWINAINWTALPRSYFKKV